jgi:conjugal transfer pilus assembly protein TraE
MKKRDSMAGAAYSDLIHTKKQMTWAIFAQSTAILFLLFMYFTKDQLIVVVPNTINEEIHIGEGVANAKYQKRYADYVASTIGNVNPNNIDHVKKNISDMLSPTLRSVLLPALEKEVTLLKVRELSQDFIVRDIIWSSKNDLVYVWGEKVTRTRNGQERDSEDYTYEVRVKPFNGYPRVLHLLGYKGTPKNNPKKAEESIKPDTPFYDGEVATIDEDGEEK